MTLEYRRMVTKMDDAPKEIWLEISVHSQTEPEIEVEHFTAPDKIAVLYRPVAIHLPTDIAINRRTESTAENKKAPPG